MTKEYIRIAELIYKDKIGKITGEEKLELLAWMNGNDFNRELFDKMANENALCKIYDEYCGIPREKIWTLLEKRIRPQRRRLLWGRIGYAASLLLLIGIGWMLFGEWNEEKSMLEQEVVRVVPGSRKAILHLNNEKQVFLTENVGVIVEDSLSGKVEQRDNKLIYQVRACGKELQHHVLEIPNGGEFQVSLSDSTKVWLNAGSRLTYPVVFAGKERRVHLEGEGYFDVKRDETKPFVVEVNGMEIKVLGTSFNVKSFLQDERSTTTLVSGSIEIQTSTGRRVKLEPNQQADFLLGENKLNVREVDAAVYGAWIKGKFVFRRERLETILDDIARWYNVTVFYEQSRAKDIVFSGIMERYVDIEETLSMLEKTQKVSFVVDKQKIIVRAE